MKSVDTNILVRLITRDDADQAAIADGVMASPVFVSLTVLLELAWVLGGKTYRYDRPTLAAVLTTLIDMVSVSVPHRAAVRWAVCRFADGADIADMIHVVASRGTLSFVSFEHDLAMAAGDDTPLPIERPV